MEVVVLQAEFNQNYVGKEEDERIMKVIEDMESSLENYVSADIADFFGINLNNLFSVED